ARARSRPWSSRARSARQRGDASGPRRRARNRRAGCMRAASRTPGRTPADPGTGSLESGALGSAGSLVVAGGCLRTSPCGSRLERRRYGEMAQPPIRPRGASTNPANRYEKLRFEGDEPPDGDDPTVYYRDVSRSVLAENDSPDVGFRFSLNPYRGCEHGCIYCYARPSHEYLGFSAGLDFERRIMVKDDAPALLRRALSSRGWEPRVVPLGGNADCYQRVERRLGLPRRCLEVFVEFRNPVGVVTKSALVARDADLLAELARHGAAHVCCSVTTLDADLAPRMEPRAARPEKRLEAIATLAGAGVPVAVLLRPLIPGLDAPQIPP